MDITICKTFSAEVVKVIACLQVFPIFLNFSIFVVPNQRF